MLDSHDNEGLRELVANATLVTFSFLTDICKSIAKYNHVRFITGFLEGRSEEICCYEMGGFGHRYLLSASASWMPDERRQSDDL